ncbi:hypothetical protein E4K39_03330 [Neisseria meningitidis]|uniref:Uncharacterized protein n=3 Tax=Neisseria meningitidis TaxID=487 RepID=E0N7Y9_NEIM3|nr:hypothetical protein A6J53_13135 [Neisseria meningitidis]EFM04896.1 hypothetical protein HMPREF0602_0619 [Neisseria meningitidis ATCC 13091]KER39784.1 hypothetical protein F528_1325 [Neisseria meningitidis 992008]ARB71523.1 hypothetical protein A6J54_07285 [Neisseria meningitidis]ARC10550.1 hypothetical protein A6J50_09865 [Neisseria meningitidis]
MGCRLPATQTKPPEDFQAVFELYAPCFLRLHDRSEQMCRAYRDVADRQMPSGQGLDGICSVRFRRPRL